MADPTPALHLPNLVPHAVTQDFPFDWSNIYPLPMSVSSRPRVPNYTIGRDRGEE
jgi:hypothetical protein